MEKDQVIDLLLEIVKEERQKRKELQISLDHTKVLLDGMYAQQRQYEKREAVLNNIQTRYYGRIECDDPGIDEIDT